MQLVDLASEKNIQGKSSLLQSVNHVNKIVCSEVQLVAFLLLSSTGTVVVCVCVRASGCVKSAQRSTHGALVLLYLPVAAWIGNEGMFWVFFSFCASQVLHHSNFNIRNEPNILNNPVEI